MKFFASKPLRPIHSLGDLDRSFGLHPAREGSSGHNRARILTIESPTQCSIRNREASRTGARATPSIFLPILKRDPPCRR